METLKQLFEERADFLEVYARPAPEEDHGDTFAWDICIRLDGTYFGGVPGELIEGWRQVLLEALTADGIDPAKLRHWHGIPKAVGAE